MTHASVEGAGSPEWECRPRRVGRPRLSCDAAKPLLPWSPVLGVTVATPVGLCCWEETASALLPGICPAIWESARAGPVPGRAPRPGREEVAAVVLGGQLENPVCSAGFWLQGGFQHVTRGSPTAQGPAAAGTPASASTGARPGSLCPTALVPVHWALGQDQVSATSAGWGSTTPGLRPSPPLPE